MHQSRSHRPALATAAAIAAIAAFAPAADAASGDQIVTGTVLSAITVTPTPVTLTGMTPGSATPAAGTGTVAVTSTDCYGLSVSDATNDGYLKSGSNAFTARLKWKYGAGSFADLVTAPATVAAPQPVTLASTYDISYQQPLANQNVPAGVYSTSATFTAASSSCPA